MYEAITESLKAFAPYPLVQASFVLLIVVIGVWVTKKGERDRKSNGNGVPQWLMYGPIKDVMDNVKDMAEQSRHMNRILEAMAQNGARITESNAHREREQREQTQLLEEIRNNQVMRMDVTTAHPVQPKPRRTNP